MGKIQGASRSRQVRLHGGRKLFPHLAPSSGNVFRARRRGLGASRGGIGGEWVCLRQHADSHHPL